MKGCNKSLPRTLKTSSPAPDKDFDVMHSASIKKAGSIIVPAPLEIGRQRYLVWMIGTRLLLSQIFHFL